MSEYANPEVLVETGWMVDRLGDPNIRVIEAGFDTDQFDLEHIPGALPWTWIRDFQHTLHKDIPDKKGWEALLGRSGIANDTTLIIYGAPGNAYATYAFWILKIYGHVDVRILNGGREKWVAEKRPMTPEATEVDSTTYQAEDPDWSIRALRDHVMASISDADRVIVDVREPGEYSGALIESWSVPEGGQRGGHIPGAVNIPWGTSRQADGTFRPVEELREVFASQGVTEDKEAIAHCVIGGRGNQTWFVLKYLLGYPRVRHYDGAWLEWGGLIGAPIET